MMARSAAALLAGWLMLPGALGVMNAGGVPYTISNPAPEGHFSTEFADESPEFFDVYAEVKTRYSQVYWTRSPNLPLPKDIVERFEGKVMAITGYEVDQVMKTPDGDKSVPIYNAYNHVSPRHPPASPRGCTSHDRCSLPPARAPQPHVT
eukprot:COSAG04_NODE_1435_length_6769_cov_40.700150_5_plen_150_part_00